METVCITILFQVLTIEEKPFVYTRRIDDGSDCYPDEIPCPHYNATEDTGKE